LSRINSFTVRVSGLYHLSIDVPKEVEFAILIFFVRYIAPQDKVRILENLTMLLAQVEVIEHAYKFMTITHYRGSILPPNFQLVPVNKHCRVVVDLLIFHISRVELIA